MSMGRTMGMNIGMDEAEASVRADKAIATLLQFVGNMKDVIASRGGTKGYIRWVRGYDESPLSNDQLTQRAVYSLFKNERSL